MPEKKVSLAKQVRDYMIDNKGCKEREVKDHFSEHAPEVVKSAFYKAKKTISNKRITLDRMEELIMSKVNKNPDVATLRLAVDFLKLKSQDQSELKELDLTLFYKKGMED